MAAAAVWVYAATRLWQTTVPSDLTLPKLDVHDWFTPKQLSDATSFERFLAINGLFAQVALVIVLFLYARHWQRFTKESAAGRIGTGLLLGMLAFAFVWIAQLPFGLAGVWWEHRHGVSKVGVFEYAIDSWFALGGRFLFVCAAIAIVMALARPFPRTWWIPGGAVFTGLALLFAFLSPYLIPDLGKLHRHDLRVAASHLAKVEGVDGVTVSVEKVHEFTTAPNAEATGIGATRRVILWDTVVRKPFTTREIRPVIAHELAHLKRGHILKSVGLFALFAFPLAFAIAVATRRRGGIYEPGAVPLAILVLTVLGILITPLQNAFVRRYETEADWVGLNATRDPAAQRATMRLLAVTARSRPNPPAAEHLFEDGHPTILERIELTKAWEKRNRR
ncbi:MAG TPA: M48 family metalloprotease [Thermoleophilaceae bacterium]|nr:M48 family metalloprotease [Thermoleophilaceae bacterium]